MSVTPKVRREVIARDHSLCGWCGLYVDTRSDWYSLQHRRARAAGGSKRLDTNLHGNLVLMCGTGTTGCHGYVEDHPLEAMTRGFNIPGNWTDPALAPALVPIQIVRHGHLVWVQLDNLGGTPRALSDVAAVAFMTMHGLIAEVPDAA